MDSKNRPLTYRAAKKGPDVARWIDAEAKEIIRLVETTKTMVFINWRDKPADRTASYYDPQVKVKIKDGAPDFRVRGTYGGNRSDYTGNRSSSTADLQTVKLLLNAAVSEDKHLATGDIHDFYLKSKLERPEYMWLTRDQVPEAIRLRYGSKIVWYNDMAIY